MVTKLKDKKREIDELLQVTFAQLRREVRRQGVARFEELDLSKKAGNRKNRLD